MVTCCLCFQFISLTYQALTAADITTDGAADYSAIPADVSFTTETMISFDVTIVGNTDIEETECFTITLSGPTAGSLDDFQTITTVCIKDDDSK